MFSWIRALFAPPTLRFEDASRLEASSKEALLLSLNKVLPDHRAWVTLEEARSLFSGADKSYAFGDTDEAGKQSIAAFAALTKSRVEFMPAENRVYFRRLGPAEASVSNVSGAR